MQVLPPRHDATAAIKKLSTTDGPASSRAANDKMTKIPVPIMVDRPRQVKSKMLSDLVKLQVFSLSQRNFGRKSTFNTESNI